MKPEDIIDAISEVKDEYISDSAPDTDKKKSGLHIPRTAIAGGTAAAVAIAIGTGLLLNSASLSAYAVAENTLPERTKYPSNFELDYEEQRDKWVDEQNEREELGNSLAQAEHFIQITTQEILTSDKNENLIYSPLNLYFATAMLAEATDGDTRSELLEILGSDSIDSSRKVTDDLWNANYNDDGRQVSVLANSLWLDNSVIPNSATTEILADKYHASTYQGEMGSSAYNKALQEWLSKNTGGMLDGYASGEEFSSETVAALASTIYFSAKWSDEFNKANNVNMPFYTPDGEITAEYMKTVDYTLIYGNSFYATSIPFRHGGNMTFILPDEDKTVNDVLADEDLYSLMLNNDYDKTKSMRVYLSIPKFDVSSKLELSQQLNALGAEKVFSAEGDFSALLGDVPAFLGKINHAARVKIDERGVEAAAYTLEILCGSAAPPEEEIYLTFDRPFLFVIESDVGCPLFVGVVNNP